MYHRLLQLRESIQTPWTLLLTVVKPEANPGQVAALPLLLLLLPRYPFQDHRSVYQAKRVQFLVGSLLAKTA